MNSARRIVAIACALLAVSGCRSTPLTNSAGHATASAPEFTPGELAFIRTDSEVFEGVVRGQLAGTDKDHPFHLEAPIFDSRPFGLDSGYARYFATLTSEDSSFPKPVRDAAFDRIIENRKSILRALNVDEGGPIPQRCPGLLVIPRPTPTDSAEFAAALAKLRANCPTKSYSYLNVSPPIRGVSASIRRRIQLETRARHLPAAELGGELWTAIVDGSYASKGGGMADEYAWVFQRDPTTGRLKLLTTAMIMIAE